MAGSGRSPQLHALPVTAGHAIQRCGYTAGVVVQRQSSWESGQSTGGVKCWSMVECAASGSKQQREAMAQGSKS